MKLQKRLIVISVPMNEAKSGGRFVVLGSMSIAKTLRRMNTAARAILAPGPAAVIRIRCLREKLAPGNDAAPPMECSEI